MADQSDPTASPIQSQSSDIAHDGSQEANTDGVRPSTQRKRRKTSPEATQRIVKGALRGNAKRSHNALQLRNRMVAQWTAMKAMEPRLSLAEGARRLNLNPATFKNYIYQATRDGFLKWDDSVDRLTYEIIPKVMDNIKEFVEKKDRVVTLETAKGTVFKQFQAQQGIQDAGQMVLTLNIETVANEEPRTIAGVIVGTPKTIEE